MTTHLKFSSISYPRDVTQDHGRMVIICCSMSMFRTKQSTISMAEGGADSKIGEEVQYEKYQELQESRHMDKFF